MVVQRFVYRQARGLSTDTTPNISDYRYLETDTGRLKFHGGTAYQLLQGFDKEETLKNKTVDLNKNTIPGIVHPSPFATSFQRTGAIIPAATAVQSLQGALRPMRAITGAGPGIPIYPKIISSQEGLCIVFETDFSSSGGYDSSAGGDITLDTVITRREYNPYFILRSRTDSTNAARLYIGYNLLATGSVPLSDTVLGDADSGIVLGFNLSTTNFSAFHNSGVGPMTVIPFPGFPKDAAFHTYEIIMTASNIVCKIDGDAHVATLTTNIPSLTTDLRLFALVQVQF